MGRILPLLSWVLHGMRRTLASFLHGHSWPALSKSPLRALSRRPRSMSRRTVIYPGVTHNCISICVGKEWIPTAIATSPSASKLTCRSTSATGGSRALAGQGGLQNYGMTNDLPLGPGWNVFKIDLWGDVLDDEAPGQGDMQWRSPTWPTILRLDPDEIPPTHRFEVGAITLAANNTANRGNPT